MARILIVEDDSEQLFLFTQLLKQPDYRVLTAKSGSESLEILDNAADFDLILCDIRMPKMDGLVLLDEVKKRYPHIPVVMMSAHTPSDWMDLALLKGADGYLRKPFTRQQLLDAVQQALNRFQTRLQNVKAMIEAGDLRGAKILLETMPHDPTAHRWLVKVDDLIAERNRARIRQKEEHELEIERSYRRGFAHAIAMLIKFHEASGELTLNDLQRMAREQEAWRQKLGPSPTESDEDSIMTIVFPPLYKEILQRKIGARSQLK
jgi:CheY-like chemotaxis protein